MSCEHEFWPTFNQLLFRENIITLECSKCGEIKQSDAHEFLTEKAKEKKVYVFNHKVEKEEIARKLSSYFSDEPDPFRVCACSGIVCVSLDCTRWWEFFLEAYSKDEIKNTLRALIDEKGWNNE